MDRKGLPELVLCFLLPQKTSLSHTCCCTIHTSRTCRQACSYYNHTQRNVLPLLPNAVSQPLHVYRCSHCTAFSVRQYTSKRGLLRLPQVS
jgi:hypothetical protein